jgi:hypothetical protein
MGYITELTQRVDAGLDSTEDILDLVVDGKITPAQAKQILGR